MKWEVLLVTLALLGCTMGEDNNTKPVVNTKDSALCKRCLCDFEIQLLDCRNKSMSEWFSDDEWNTLANGSVLFETIRLEHNNLAEIPMLKAIPVKNLYLSYNSIAKIENAAFHNLLNLTILDLSHNKLTTKALRPEVFQGNYNPSQYEPLPKMTELHLSHNELHSLDPDVFEHLPNLETLNLGSNVFHVIDHLTETAIAQLLSLKTLDMSYMELDDLPDNLLHSPRDLETLILTGNLLDELPDGLGLAINLKRLIFDENPMGNLEGENVFPNMSKLEYLSISYSNDLVTVGEGALSNLQGLKTLILSSNPHMSNIHPRALARPTVNPIIFDYPPLEELYLHNNNLTILDHDLIERWDKVKTIDLRLNPWRCDCDNAFLIKTLMTQINSTTPKMVNDVVCNSPAAWNSTQLITINGAKKILLCPNNDHPENDAGLLIGILLGVLVGTLLSFAALTVYRRGCFGLMNRNRGASPLYNRASFQDDFHI